MSNTRYKFDLNKFTNFSGSGTLELGYTNGSTETTVEVDKSEAATSLHSKIFFQSNSLEWKNVSNNKDYISMAMQTPSIQLLFNQYLLITDVDKDAENIEIYDGDTKIETISV